MALKTFNPITPSQRHLVIVDRGELWKGKPVKALTEGLRQKGGRNNTGRITMRWRGGGHKRRYRVVDFKRIKDDAHFVNTYDYIGDGQEGDAAVWTCEEGERIRTVLEALYPRRTYAKRRRRSNK